MFRLVHPRFFRGRSRGFTSGASSSNRPRSGDEWCDWLGEQAPYRESHNTVDLIFTHKLRGKEVRIYQGGHLRANDLEYITQISIALVINVTGNVASPPWLGQPDTPQWCRFMIPSVKDGPVLFGFERLYRLVLNSLREGGNVLIIFRAGAHRAGTCTSAYAIMAYGLSPFAAVQTVSRRRRCTQVTGNLFVALNALHREMTRLAKAFHGADWSAPAATPAALDDDLDEDWSVAAAPAAFLEAEESASAEVVAKAIPVKRPPAAGSASTTSAVASAASSAQAVAVLVKAALAAAPGARTAPVQAQAIQVKVPPPKSFQPQRLRPLPRLLFAKSRT